MVVTGGCGTLHVGAPVACIRGLAGGTTDLAVVVEAVDTAAAAVDVVVVVVIDALTVQWRWRLSWSC